MTKKIALAASLMMAFAGAAMAQTATCTCDGSAARTADAAALTALLTNRMVCANVGGEVWQEWHNGTSSGPVVDYKQGPGDAKDPSATVGSYTVNADNTVTYTYGAQSYNYDVCLAGSTYTYCGAAHGGRNITGARIGGAGLAPCSSVVSVAPLSTRDLRTTKQK